MNEYNLAKMIQGHEIWLETSGIEKNTAQLSILYGHNMRMDGMVDKNRFLSLFFSPDGMLHETNLVTVDDRHYLNIPMTMDGYYTAYADMGVVIWSKNDTGYFEGPKFKFKDITYAGAYHQMAKIIIPKGEPRTYNPQPLHGILEIVPRTVQYRVGDVVELDVFYEDIPLPSTEIKAISKKEGKEISCMKTDENGFVRIPLTVDGEWMFLARHTDPEKKINEEFDESVFISTLVLEAR